MLGGWLNVVVVGFIPQIKELRSVRQQFQELEHTYLNLKSAYDNVAVGLESERLKLEAECESRQNECVREESRFHYYHAMVSIADVRKQKVRPTSQMYRSCTTSSALNCSHPHFAPFATG